MLWALLLGVTLELCARVDDWLSYGAPPFGVYNAQTLYTWDDLGQRGKPHARYLKWKLNSLGYRGDELAPGRVRLACVGSSETFGLYEREGGEWPQRLEKELNRRAGGDVFQVVNTAYPGMSIAASLARLPEVIRQIEPSVFVVYPSFASYIWLPWLEAEAGARPRPPRFEPRMTERVKNLAKNALPLGLQHEARRFAIWRAAGGGAVMTRLPEENVERFRSDMVRLLDAVAAAGRQAVLVTHATRFGAERRPDDEYHLVAWRRFYPMMAEEGLLDMEDRMNHVLRELGRSRGLVVVDAAEAIEPGSKFFVEFVHFTDDGAQKLATLVADGLEPLISCAQAGLEDCNLHHRYAHLGN